MTIALLATFAFTSGSATFSASDYFPLRTGSRMTYEEKSLQSGTTVDVVEAPVEINFVKVVPVTTFQNGSKVNTTYYRVDEDGVAIYAYDVKAPLPKPLPVLKVAGAEKVAWRHEGPATTEQVAEAMVMTGEAQMLKTDREVLGKKVPAIQVKIVAIIGGGRAREEIEQVSVYGKGIGLIESTSTTKIGKRKAVSTLKLIKIEEPKEGS
jgi:hypothetical protein